MKEATAATEDAVRLDVTNPLHAAGTGPGRPPSPSRSSSELLQAKRASTTELDLDATLAREAAADGQRYRRSQRRMAVGSIAALLVLGVVAALVVYLSSPSPGSLNIPKEFSGRWTAYSRYSTDYTVAGRIRKTEGADGRSVVEAEASYVESDTGLRIVLTYLDKRAFRAAYNDSVSTSTPVSVTCVPVAKAPPLGDLGGLIDQATPAPPRALDKNNTALVQCIAAPERWLLQWGVQTFVYCNPSSDGHVVASDNFHAVFVADSPMVDSLGLAPPVDPATGAAKSCPVLDDVSALGRDDVPHHATGRRLHQPSRARRLPLMMSLTAPQRPCIFVHGTGHNKDESAKTDKFESYWGQIHNVLAPQCSSFQFLRRDMQHSTWDDPSHATAFCDEAAGGSSGHPIGNKLIFSHGSGSLVVAAAIHNNVCSMSSTTRWYSSHGMFGGAKAADAALGLCANYDALQDILSKLDVCHGKDKDTVEPGVTTQQTTYNSPSADWSTLTSVARTHLDGAMCGHSSQGNYQGVAVGLVAIDSELWFGEDRDGWMKLSQCKTAHTSSSWGHNKDSTWANMHTNFLDGACLWDDPLVDTSGDHSPCKWYLNMAKRA